MTPSVTTLDNTRHTRRVPERGRSPVRGAAEIMVADSLRAVDWLSSIGKRAGMPWRVRGLEAGMIAEDVLVLSQPEGSSKALRHWITARRVVVSLDSPKGRRMALSRRIETFTFSEGRDAADVTAKDLHFSAEGLLRFVAVTRSALTRVEVEQEELYPALSALACAVWLGVPLELAGEVVSESRNTGAGKLISMA